MECARQRYNHRAFHFTSHRYVKKLMTRFRIDGRTINTTPQPQTSDVPSVGIGQYSDAPSVGIDLCRHLQPLKVVSV